MDIFSESFDPKRDLPKDRVIPVDNGSDFHIKQQDPHGFWHISREHGQVPQKLSGAYTSYEKAAQAVKVYMSNLPKATPKSETKDKK